MASWTLDDIPWDRFDPSRVDPDIIPLVKTASVVEYNAEDYKAYLCNVFPDDPRLRIAVASWAEEERQHGLALRRWAELADPSFDFDAKFKRFREGFQVPIDVVGSVRGSRTGELIARCMVETGTTSYYTSLAEATNEPVLEAICRRIASDETAHFWLFYNYMNRYLEKEKLGFWSRLAVALERIAESEDEELAFAYYAANTENGEAFDRRASIAAYGRRSLRFWTPEIVRNAVSMVLSAIGLRPQGLFSRALAFGACIVIGARRRIYALGKAAV